NLREGDGSQVILAAVVDNLHFRALLDHLGDFVERDVAALDGVVELAVGVPLDDLRLAGSRGWSERLGVVHRLPGVGRGLRTVGRPGPEGASEGSAAPQRGPPGSLGFPMDSSRIGPSASPRGRVMAHRAGRRTPGYASRHPRLPRPG